MSFETGARFSRSTLLLGMDLSCAASSWLHAHVASAAARTTTTTACVENRFFVLRLIAYPFVLSQPILLDLCRAHFSAERAHDFCYSERSEESLLGFGQRKEGEILRFAQNDNIEKFLA